MSGPETSAHPGNGARPVSRRRILEITAIAGLGLALGGSVTREILRLAGLAEVRASRRHLGTRVTISVLHTDREAARHLVDDAFATMERLESILSRHRRGTALDRLNAAGSLADPPPDLVAVLGRGLDIARMSDGAFDPTVRPLLALYERWAESGPGARPDPAAIEAARGLVDYRDVLVTDDALTLARPGMGVTLDGIAKGYVVDRTTERLVAEGAEQVMVEAGGDLSAGRRAGGRADRPWRLAIQDPRSSDGMLGVVSIEREGMASSGDYIQSFTADRSLHHILDPRTGGSPADLSAATVIAPSAMDADALSTTAMVLGPTRTIDLIDSMDGVEALLVAKDGRRIASRRFQRYLTPGSA